MRTGPENSPRADVQRLAGLTVLGFHAVRDLSGTPVAPYGIPKDEFADAIDTLTDAGMAFVDPGDLFDQTSSLEPYGRPCLITFDDCYEDILYALEVLSRRSLRALVFPVSSLIGRSNEWDRALGAPVLPLLSADGLRTLRSSGWMVGSHSHTHAVLTSLDDDAIAEEMAQSIRILDDLGLGRARSLAYPFGEHDHRVAAIARGAGIDLAFTTEPGVVTEQSDPLAIPRIEVLRGDRGAALLSKMRRP